MSDAGLSLDSLLLRIFIVIFSKEWNGSETAKRLSTSTPEQKEALAKESVADCRDLAARARGPPSLRLYPTSIN